MIRSADMVDTKLSRTGLAPTTSFTPIIVLPHWLPEGFLVLQKHVAPTTLSWGAVYVPSNKNKSFSFTCSKAG